MSTIEFLRQYKIGSFAMVDFVVSFLGFYLISPIIIKIFEYAGLKITVPGIMWFVVPISIAAHIAVGTYTPLTKMFLDPSGYYSIKLIILVMVILGAKEISKI